MKFTIICSLLLLSALFVSTSHIKVEEELAYSKAESFTNSHFFHSLQSFMKHSLSEADGLLTRMAAEYVAYEMKRDDNDFPFKNEATEIVKLKKMLHFMQKPSEKIVSHLNSEHLSEIKEKIAEKSETLTQMLQKGYSMVKKMVKNAEHSRFVSRKLFTSFSKFVSVSAVSKVYNELLESLNIGHKLANKLTLEVATRGNAKVGENCTTTADCVAGLECGVDDDSSINKCAAPEDSHVTESTATSKKKLGQVCKWHIRNKDSECEEGLKCSFLLKKCIYRSSMATTLINSIKDYISKCSQKNDLKTETDTIKTEASTDGAHLAANVKAGTEASGAPTLPEKTGFIQKIKTRLLKFKATFNEFMEKLFGKIGIKALSLGFEVKGTLTALNAAGSINYAYVFANDAHNYWFIEGCIGIESNIGLAISGGITVKFLHEPIEEAGGSESSFEMGLGFDVEVEPWPVGLAIDVALSFSSKNGAITFGGFSAGLAVQAGKKALKVAVTQAFCKAKRITE